MRKIRKYLIGVEKNEEHNDFVYAGEMLIDFK